MRSVRALWLVLVAVLVAVPARAEIYRWVDDAGIVHLDDDIARVPEAQRSSSRVFHSRVAPAAPVVNGPTEGSFASGVAREIGLLRSQQQDPVSVLQVVGIYPAAGWYPAGALSPAVVDEVVSAARAAARARRLTSSEATVEAAVLRVASSLGVAGPAPAALPDPPPAPEPPALIIVAPNVIVESPPVIVSVIQPAPPPAFSSYPAFAYGVPFASVAPGSLPVGPPPRRLAPLASAIGSPLRGPLVQPLRAPLVRPLGF